MCRYAATRACKAAWRPKLLEDVDVGAQWWIGVAFMDDLEVSARLLRFKKPVQGQMGGG